MIAAPGPALPALPVRAPVIEVPISPTSYDEVLRLLERGHTDRATLFFFCNVHSVMTARRDPALATAVARADVTTPDGVPLMWALRRTGYPDQERVYGPDLMELALPYGVEHGWRHWFLGTTPDTLARLTERAEALAPGIDIAGTTAPPFRPLTDQEVDAIVAEVGAAGTDLLWIGMGMPKQELLAARLRDRLPGVRILAVGAGFDFLAGTVSQAPDWMQQRGLEWLYRLVKEPRRLWRRYVINNPLYLLLLARQLWHRRRS